MKRAASNKLQQLQAWIRGIETAMLTTEDRLGHLRSRPMVALDATPDDALWFFSDASSAKIDDIHGHHNVNLSYSDPASGRFVSVTGRARIMRDRARMTELWSGKLKNWFSKGPDDPEIVLLRVEIFEAELWQSGERSMEVNLEVTNETPSAHETLTFA
jgi:general stress protein 26